MQNDLNTFDQHGVGLVFFCELHEAHHKRGQLLHGWKRIGRDEFLIAMAPGWRCSHAELCKVWPEETTDPKRTWRVYFQAGGSAGR